MHKAFFGCALALPQLTVASAVAEDQDHFELNIAQIDLESLTMVEDFSIFGQIDAQAEPEAAEFWSVYMAQVDAVLQDQLENPYWTDGYTSLSQIEVDALISQDANVQLWGKKGGLAQLSARSDADGPVDWMKAKINGVKNKVVEAVSSTGKSVGIFIDAAAKIMPTKEQVGAFLSSNLGIDQLAMSMKTKGYSPANILTQFLENKVAPAAGIISMLGDIPGIKGMKDLSAKVSAGAADAAAILKVFTSSDDGTPKDCWQRSKLRSFGFSGAEKCKADGKQPGIGGVCYDQCPDGKGSGSGPICWGSCNEKTHRQCGALCQLKEGWVACEKMVASVTTSAIDMGVHAASGDYIGAVLGGLSVAARLAYPICKDWN